MNSQTTQSQAISNRVECRLSVLSSPPTWQRQWHRAIKSLALESDVAMNSGSTLMSFMIFHTLFHFSEFLFAFPQWRNNKMATNCRGLLHLWVISFSYALYSSSIELPVHLIDLVLYCCYSFVYYVYGILYNIYDKIWYTLSISYIIYIYIYITYMTLQAILGNEIMVLKLVNEEKESGNLSYLS